MFFHSWIPVEVWVYTIFWLQHLLKFGVEQNMLCIKSIFFVTNYHYISSKQFEDLSGGGLARKRQLKINNLMRRKIDNHVFRFIETGPMAIEKRSTFIIFSASDYTFCVEIRRMIIKRLNRYLHFYKSNHQYCPET